MQNLKQLLNKPVLSLYEGELIGTINGIYLDKRLKKFYLLSIKTEEDLEYILYAKNIYHIGKNAITIKNNSYIILKSDSDLEVEELVNPLTFKIYTMQGEYKGMIEDIVVNEKYETSSLVIENGKELMFDMPANCSKNTVILYDKGSRTTASNFKQRTINITKFFKQEKNKNVEIQPIERANVVEVDKSMLVGEEIERKEVATPLKSIVNNTDFLINRKTTSNIYGLNDEVIIKSNTVITQKVIALAYKFGKLQELMLKCK